MFGKSDFQPFFKGPDFWKLNFPMGQNDKSHSEKKITIFRPGISMGKKGQSEIKHTNFRPLENLANIFPFPSPGGNIKISEVGDSRPCREG